MSIIWAFYMDRLSVKKLSNILGLGRTVVYERIRNAYSEVDQVVTERASQIASERSVHLDAQHAHGAEPEYASNTIRPDTDPSAAENTETPGIKPFEQPGGVHIVAGQLFVQANTNMRLPSAERHDPELAAPAKQKANNDAERFFMALAVLVVIVATYLQHAAPLPSAAVIVLLAGWRVFVYSRRAVSAWQASDKEQRSLCLFALLPWLVLIALTALLLLDIAPTQPLPASDFIGVTLRRILIATLLLVLGAIDSLFRIAREKPSWGLWRHLVPSAEFVAKHRWEAIGYGWLIVVVVVVSSFIASYLYLI